MDNDAPASAFVRQFVHQFERLWRCLQVSSGVLSVVLFILARRPALSFPVLPAGLPNAPGKSAESFASRVVSAWTAWQHCGTPRGILLALSVAGLDGVQIHPKNGLCYTLVQGGALHVEHALFPLRNGLDSDSAGPLLDDSGQAIHPSWTIHAAPFWSEFELIIPANAWINSDTGDIILPNESDPAAQTIKRLVRQWKGAHCRCANIILQKHIDAPLVGFPRRTIGTIAQSDGTNAGGLWTQNSGWFDRAPNDFRAQWTMNAQ